MFLTLILPLIIDSDLEAVYSNFSMYFVKNFCYFTGVNCQRRAQLTKGEDRLTNFGNSWCFFLSCTNTRLLKTTLTQTNNWYRTSHIFDIITILNSNMAKTACGLISDRKLMLTYETCIFVFNNFYTTNLFISFNFILSINNAVST